MEYWASDDEVIFFPLFLLTYDSTATKILILAVIAFCVCGEVR